MKICIISLGAYPLFNPTCTRTFGGSEVQLFLLAQELSKNPDMEVHVIVGDFGQPAIEHYGAITVHKGMRAGAPAFLRSAKVELLLGAMRSIDADITIQRSASPGTGLVAFFAHLWKQKFLYMTAHEIDCNGGFEKQNNWLLGKLFQYGIRHADCIVTQSKEHAGMIQQHHKRESLVIPSLYAIPTEEELARVEKKHVLWVGRCEDWKRPEVFIDLAEKHPTETFVMISPVSNNQSAYYTQLKERLAHAPANLTHIPYVPFAEIDQYFKEAKVFVNTSTYEGFPNTFLQAMKNKTPILSLVVNPDNILTTQQCGLQANNNTETLQQQLTTLLQNTSDRTQLGENGYRYCAARHASAHIAKQYTALFQKMLGRDRL